MPLANSNIYTTNPSKTLLFFKGVYTMFSVKNTVIYTFFGIKSIQNTGFCSVFNDLASKSPSIPLSPQTLENTAIYCFLQFFYVPRPLANSNIYTTNPSKTLFFFYSVFTMFSVKNTVIYTFFGIKSVQTTGFCSVFNALAAKSLSKYHYLQCFFIFVRSSITFTAKAVWADFS